MSGVDRAEAQRLLEAYNGSPMRYRDNGRAIASVVFLWPGTVFTFARYVNLSESLGLETNEYTAHTSSGAPLTTLTASDQSPPTHALATRS